MNPDFNSLFEVVWGILKWVYVFAFGLYVVFALVVLTQIRQMTAALSDQFNGVMKLIGLGHLLVAVGCFLLALIVL